jgi:hypothetical protein
MNNRESCVPENLSAQGLKKKQDSRTKFHYNLSISEPIEPDSISQSCSNAQRVPA